MDGRGGGGREGEFRQGAQGGDRGGRRGGNMHRGRGALSSGGGHLSSGASPHSVRRSSPCWSNASWKASRRGTSSLGWRRGACPAEPAWRRAPAPAPGRAGAAKQRHPPLREAAAALAPLHASAAATSKWRMRGPTRIRTRGGGRPFSDPLARTD